MQHAYQKGDDWEVSFNPRDREKSREMAMTAINTLLDYFNDDKDRTEQTLKLMDGI